MPYVIGILLSLSVALFARRVGFDRDRAFYPTVLILIASYYGLCAAMSGSVHTVLLDTASRAQRPAAGAFGASTHAQKRAGSSSPTPMVPGPWGHRATSADQISVAFVRLEASAVTGGITQV